MAIFNNSSHCKYLLQYHIVWCPKFRYSVLNQAVEPVLKDCLLHIATRYGYEIKVMEVMPDHIHLLVATKPTVAPTDVVRTLKSLSAIELFSQFPELKKFYGRCGLLWSKGYFVSTVGNVSQETLTAYILNQKIH